MLDVLKGYLSLGKKNIGIFVCYVDVRDELCLLNFLKVNVF